jgi:hypothetical protein
MSFSPEDILEEFTAVAKISTPPKLRRRWWWKPNSQLSGATVVRATVAGRLETHEVEHPTYKVGCNICWVRAEAQGRPKMGPGGYPRAGAPQRRSRAMGDEPEKQTHPINPVTVRANQFVAVERERSGAIRIQARVQDGKGGILLGRTKQELRTVINVIFQLMEEIPAASEER